MVNFRAKFSIKDSQEQFKAKFHLKDEKIPAILKLNTGYTLKGSELIEVQHITSDILKLNSKTFIFEQGIASDVWDIVHNLNKRPSITLVDSSGRVFEAVKDYIDDNHVIVTLASATAGKAYLN